MLLLQGCTTGATFRLQKLVMRAVAPNGGITAVLAPLQGGRGCVSGQGEDAGSRCNEERGTASCVPLSQQAQDLQCTGRAQWWWRH